MLYIVGTGNPCTGSLGLLYGSTTYPAPRPSFAHGTPDGYTIYFSCEEGRHLVGPTNSTCLDGTWSHQPGTCEIK